MPLTDLVCTTLFPARGLCVVFPGGSSICATAGLETGDASTVVRSFVGQLSTGLAPVQPTLTLIETALAIKDCLMAIPAMFSVPPQPQRFSEGLASLLAAIDKLLQLLPQVWVPRMVAQIINVLIYSLLAQREEIAVLSRQLARIAASLTKAAKPGNHALVLAIDCAQASYDVSLQNLSAGVEPINQLVHVVNALLDLAQVPIEFRVPSFDHLGTDLEVALVGIDAAVAFLQVLADVLPPPD
jgi:hypothetical protein